MHVEAALAEIDRLRLPPDERARTHWDGCWRDPGHHACAVAEVLRRQAEVDRLTLRWSDAKPTVTGPYLHRDPSGRVTVGWFTADDHGGVWAAASGAGCGYGWPAEMKGQWAGPIPLPIEPAATEPGEVAADA